MERKAVAQEGLVQTGAGAVPASDTALPCLFSLPVDLVRMERDARLALVWGPLSELCLGERCSMPLGKYNAQGDVGRRVYDLLLEE